MKTNKLHRPAAILTGVAALMMLIFAASSAMSQEKKEQKTTATVTTSSSSSSKDKKEQKATVTVKADSKNKDGKYNVRIVKEADGKKTIIDTVISSKGGIDSKEMEELMENIHVKLKDTEGKMKELELYFNSMNDSLLSDSSGHHKYMFKFIGPSGCQNIHIKEFPHAFDYNFEIPDVPEPPMPPEGFNHEFFNQWTPGPQVLSIPKRGESLSDVLGNIPMSRVKSYKIIDKKGGKRIIIDLEDGPLFESGDRVIYLNGAGRPQRHTGEMRHQKDMKVIINSGADEKDTEKPESPAPPAEPKKTQSGSPTI